MNDIAKALNLSASTVSKALSNSYEISEKTKKLVLEYAEANNYRPNLIAQSLKHGHSNSIGIVVANIDNHFFSQVINGIESIAYQEGYNVIFTQTHESYDLEVKNVTHLAHRSVDGLLISLSTETQNIEHLQKLQEQGLPIVFFDRVSDEMDTHKVIVDNFKGAYEATVHLIRSGYKNIAHITSTANTYVTRERLSGYTQALTDNGIAINEQLIKYCVLGGRDQNEIKGILNELLTNPVKPDAIFTAFDRITTVTLGLLHQLKIKIPQDIALLGFTNTVLADVLNPSLSTVYQPGFEMGQEATKMLISLIKTKRPVTDFETIVLPTQLFLRDSTAKK
ncbi:LacI family DNA-binding transcriptional regulator [Mucilaginibacter sp.]|uniref:LacI family DNA-binding transcriptional regulator n=1 Tax=Mucilaginibacter sp. TaxID=1882438 RepID=UPI00260F512A|nr:LacI family DNA-binding transcriptional regulator [Mucilaginibacter sp.]